MYKNTMSSLHVGVVSLQLEAESKTRFFYKNLIAKIENTVVQLVVLINF